MTILIIKKALSKEKETNLDLKSKKRSIYNKSFLYWNVELVKVEYRTSEEICQPVLNKDTHTNTNINTNTNLNTNTNYKKYKYKYQ